MKMVMFIMLIMPAVLASAYYLHLKHSPLVSLELLILIPTFIFLVNLLCLGFLVIIGYETLVLAEIPLTVSFLFKYCALSLASAILLPNLLLILEFTISALARIIAKSSRINKPEQGTHKEP
jgi:hypothetical protein